ncbi:hypothetical protein [Microbacterium terricola]|uniref:Uncharacterized protein n=1 Tax=Microbacterium terricola TaxID=344163 RepID=A0ABM8DZG5_9MICO|nr:hypothetical protein [Microbacterium terricola]UYK41307.1 hypothetical protein OAU46_06660 [Microbacterium terricola]BDV30911.1 hypothetical protein Microterr_15710 [Microbacterium terricola]
MGTRSSLRRVALGLVLALPAVAGVAVPASLSDGQPGPAPHPAATRAPVWRSAPNWPQLRLCAEDRVARAEADSFERAWARCVALMSIAERAGGR